MAQSAVIWATNHLGDNQLQGDTFRSTGRHNFDYLALSRQRRKCDIPTVLAKYLSVLYTISICARTIARCLLIYATRWRFGYINESCSTSSRVSSEMADRTCISSHTGQFSLAIFRGDNNSNHYRENTASSA